VDKLKKPRLSFTGGDHKRKGNSEKKVYEGGNWCRRGKLEHNRVPKEKALLGRGKKKAIKKLEKNPSRNQETGSKRAARSIHGSGSLSGYKLISQKKKNKP